MLEVKTIYIAAILQIYERDVMFRQQVGNLQLIVGIYNNVQATILPVEKPLITQKLEAVDAALKKGLQVSFLSIIFNSHGSCNAHVIISLHLLLQCLARPTVCRIVPWYFVSDVLHVPHMSKRCWRILR